MAPRQSRVERGRNAVRRLGWLFVAVLALAAPAAAQLTLPEPIDAGERALLPEIGGALGSGHATLAQLDTLLAKLPRPSPLHGAVQLARSVLLTQADHYPPAVTAAEEAVRLLPAWPQPKLLLTYLLTFTGAPQRAADLWLEASRQSPEVARESDLYTLDALAGRLQEMGDTSRARLLATRMAEIGFAHQLAPDRSSLAAAQFEQAAVKGDTDRAGQALPEVASPTALIGFYVDKRYQPFWPAIQTQGGPDLGLAQRRYFTLVRDEWQQARDYRTAVNYARLLASVHDYSAVVSLFAGMFTDAQDHLDDPYMWLLAPVVARSFAETGKSADGRALLTRLNTVAVSDPGMQLNASGNLANLSFLLQRWDEAAREAADWLKIAAREGAAINRGSILQVSAVRACALTRSGHGDQAAALIGDLLLAQRALPQPALTLFVCTHDLSKARELMVDRLADADSRGWALQQIQPNGRSGALPEEMDEARFLEQVRRDPAVRTAAEQVGRILPSPVANTLPDGFDPDGGPPAKLMPGSV